MSITAKLKYIKESEGIEFTCNEEVLVTEYEKQSKLKTGIVIKLLSLAGSTLGILAFLGFIFVSELYRAPVLSLIIGIAFVSASIFMDKHDSTNIIDTLKITAFITGAFLIGFSLDRFKLDDNIVLLVMAAISLLVLLVSRTWLITFTSIQFMNICFIFLIHTNRLFYLINIQIALIAAILTYMVINEGKILADRKKLSHIYSPVLSGLMIALISCLYTTGVEDLFRHTTHIPWISSVIISLLIIFFVHKKLLVLLGIDSSRSRAVIVASIALISATIVYAPSINGALLIILLFFYLNHKSGVVCGVISLVYFICLYYYDMKITLLNKSLILMASGLMFLALYYFIQRRYKND